MMEKIEHGHPLSQSPDFVAQNIETLKQLFPTIVKEGKIDLKELQALLGQEVETEEEYYRFTWAGKSLARREANKPSTATLRPDKASSKDWDTTQNIFIEGDNLEVLKLLQKSYANKIKMIYIDPPYNTGKDFVYKDNYSDNLGNYLALTGQVDDDGKRLSTNSESDGRYHSNWLNMMYPRLKLARNLLKDDGVIFISIDDNEIVNIRKVCDEVLGEDNFICTLVRKRRDSQANLSKNISPIHEYVIVYAKTNGEVLNKIQTELNESEFKNPDNDPRGVYITMPCTNKGGTRYKVTLPNGRIVEDEWRFKKETFNKLLDENRIVVPKGGEGKPRYKLFLHEKKESGVLANTWLDHLPSNQEGTREIKDLFNELIFDTPKPVGLIKFLQDLSTSKDSIILDFFAGSGSTANSVIQKNSEDEGSRKFICIQLPEPVDEQSEAFKAGYKTIAEITKERIRRAGEKIKAELKEDLFSGEGKTLDIGFRAFKLDSSNLYAWDGSPENLEATLFNTSNNIKEDRSEEDVLYEILLKYGLDLTLPIEQRNIGGQQVFNIGMGALFICLGTQIETDVAEGIGKWKDELQPAVTRVIFRDNGFSDVGKTNSMQILKRYGIEEVHTI